LIRWPDIRAHLQLPEYFGTLALIH
jgi:hypothetical protein